MLNIYQVWRLYGAPYHLHSYLILAILVDAGLMNVTHNFRGIQCTPNQSIKREEVAKLVERFKALCFLSRWRYLHQARKRFANPVKNSIGPCNS